MKSNIAIFTKFNLDGVVAYILCKHFLNANLELYFFSSKEQEQSILNWLLKHKIEKYDSVYFLGLETDKYIDLIDFKNSLIINNHKSLTKYANAKLISIDYSSLSSLLYTILRKKLPEVDITNEIDKLVLLANDYATFTLQYKESKILNYLFWQNVKNISDFINTIKFGFKGFDKQQLESYISYLKEFKEYLKQIEVYSNPKVDILGKDYYVVSVIMNKGYIDEITDYIFKKFNNDILFIVNVETQHINIRRRAGTDINLLTIARDLIDGGGYVFSAGGTITPDFLEISKMLSKTCILTT